MTVTKPTKKRRTYAARVPSEQRRTQLLDAALDLVTTVGHRATTMETVAEQAGVTKPVVYGTFASRTDLLSALLRREHEHALHQLLAVLPEHLEPPISDPAELLGTLLGKFLGAVQAAPQRWHCIVMPMADMPAEFHTVREQARALLLGRAEDIARDLLAGVPAELDYELLAHTGVTLFEMAARLVLTDPEHFQPARFVTGIHTAIGLSAPRG